LDAGESATKKSPDRKPYKQTETESRVAREVSPGARAPPSNEGFDGELGNPRGRREQYLRRRRADEGEERGGGARVGSPLGFETCGLKKLEENLYIFRKLVLLLNLCFKIRAE